MRNSRNRRNAFEGAKRIKNNAIEVLTVVIAHR
jgi:hypothetical protein